MGYSQSLGHEIHMPRTFSSPTNQSIETSNFLRCALDFWWSQDPSLCGGSTLSRTNCKPFQIKHRSQHCEDIPVHTDSRLFVFVVKVARQSSALRESHRPHQQTGDFRSPTHGCGSRAIHRLFEEANLMHARVAQLVAIQL